MTSNRLGESLSPYLRQHAGNPVHWQEWGPEAFAEARERQVPILLSVGYAACHWCHVMAHESFESEDVAAVLNAGFVSIKVDREERPDVDAAYMAATTAMTGAGGWPMTCLLTPDGRPFFAGTYLPRAQLLSLLAQVERLWLTRRDDVLGSSANIAQQLATHLPVAAGGALGAGDLDAAARRLRNEFDPAWGGFGGAPKFPPSMVLLFLLRHHARTGSPDSIAMVAATGSAMARGGIHDQLGGGFARYSVDARWVVPHFEKMLYDNALLLRAYAEWWRSAVRPGGAEAGRSSPQELAPNDIRRVVEGTAEFLLRDLRTPEGAFASALDADTDGVEGLTYAWTPDQVHAVLGDEAAAALPVLGVTREGTFEHGASTVRYLGDPDPTWWGAVRDRLHAARRQRPQPARDDKVVTSWNGLAIAGLALAGSILDRPDYVAAARTCADFLVREHRSAGRLVRVSLGGRAGKAPAMADDYGNLIDGLCVLYSATGEDRWIEVATTLADTAITLFVEADGSLRATPRDGEQLYLTPPAGGDNAEPAGASALAGGLLALAALSGRTDLRSIADSALAAAAPARSSPRFAGWTLAIAEASLAGPVQVAVVGDDGEAAAMRRAAWASTSPGLVLAHSPGDAQSRVGLLEGRGRLGGRSSAYVCRGFVCDLPVTTAVELSGRLAGAPKDG